MSEVIEQVENVSVIDGRIVFLVGGKEFNLVLYINPNIPINGGMTYALLDKEKQEIFSMSFGETTSLYLKIAQITGCSYQEASDLPLSDLDHKNRQLRSYAG